jgi:hypothetical protein
MSDHQYLLVREGHMTKIARYHEVVMSSRFSPGL